MSEIKCTTIEKIGIIRQGANGWNKELRLVRWNDADPKYDKIGRASCRERV